ncbi:MAG TPA: hypothetical protein VFZ09_35820 [Archangium sp.]|uniref:hypothetical protein n=1 Tax=Archangium sp. TaxID=1872627 RepID=UPI002E2EFF55|nr:hypothetical protein [Archangium sp.]HEX5751645.1 hypothetical protein [Archangium sp.]
MRKSLIRCGLVVACVLAGCGGEEWVEDVEDVAEGGMPDDPDDPVTAMHVPVEQRDAFAIPFDGHGLSPTPLSEVRRGPNAGRRPIRILNIPRPRRTPGTLATLPKSELNRLDLDDLRGPGFPGLGRDFSSFSSLHEQPAPSGDVDSDYYVQAVNDTIAVFDKRRGGIIAGPLPAQRLWAGTPCEGPSLTDGTVRYDSLNKRWIITYRGTVRAAARTRIETVSTADLAPDVQASWANRDRHYQCVAVSQTSNPTGSYFRYVATFEGFNAFPKLSVWRDAYYLTTTMSSVGADGEIHPRRARICAMEQAKMLEGRSARMLCFNLDAHVKHYQDLLAADLDMGATPGDSEAPPVGAPLHVFSLRQTRPRVPMTSRTYDFFNRLGVWKVFVDWNAPEPRHASTLIGPHELRVERFQMEFEVKPWDATRNRESSSVRLNPLEYKLSGRAPYRNFGDHQAVLLTHAINRPGDSTRGSALRWYEIRLPAAPQDWPASQPYQYGTYAPDDGYRWLGSIAFDKAGNIALAYTVTGRDRPPSLFYTGRTTSCDATGPRATRGTMARVEKELKLGGDRQEFPNWSTSSTLNVDPDGCTFWYTAQYTRGRSIQSFWRTHIRSFQLPGCASNSSQAVRCPPYP